MDDSIVTRRAELGLGTLPYIDTSSIDSFNTAPSLPKPKSDWISGSSSSDISGDKGDSDAPWLRGGDTETVDTH